MTSASAVLRSVVEGAPRERQWRERHEYRERERNHAHDLAFRIARRIERELHFLRANGQVNANKRLITAPHDADFPVHRRVPIRIPVFGDQQMPRGRICASE